MRRRCRLLLDGCAPALRVSVLFGAIVAANVLAAGVDLPPRPDSPVADYARVLDAENTSRISTVAQALWEQAGFGLVVATFPSFGDEPIDDFANRLYGHWGIGAKGRDEGALVILSLDPRKVRIEVGYGAEGYLNDAKTGRLLDTYGLPDFRENRFAQGLAAVSMAIAQEVAREKNITLSTPGFTPRQEIPQTRLSWFHILLIMLAVAFLLGTPFGRTLLWMMILSSMTRGGGGSYRSGGFGGGIGGGGFGGGFGGGMSGGGGASRGF